MVGESGIAYQNKDIASKLFAEQFKSDYLEVYNLNLPKMIGMLPTNLPAIEANELRIDNLFLLEDGSLLIIDYESIYKKINKMKYINYINRVAKRYLREGKDVKIHMLIIYTADVTVEQTESIYDNGALRLQLEEVFLSDMNGDAIVKTVEMKISNGEKLTSKEIMELIMLPLSYKGSEKKKKMIDKAFQIAKNIQDEDIQKFVLSGMLVFTDKIIEEKDLKGIRRWLSMTKIGRMYEEEKRQAVEQEKQEKQEIARKYARVLLAQGWDTDRVVKEVEVLSEDEVNRLR